jgi:hypothetical protein
MQERKTNRNQNGGGGGGGGGGVAGNHNGGSAADPLTAQANIILRFEEELKAAIFNVMYILLKESDISFWKYALIITIDFLQMLQFTFDSSVSYLISLVNSLLNRWRAHGKGTACSITFLIS